MKINLSKEVRNGCSILGHMVCEALTDAAMDQMETEIIDNALYSEVIITVGGQEIDLKKFVTFWQNQVDRQVAEVAKGIIRDKMCHLDFTIEHISEFLEDVEDKIGKEIEKIATDTVKETQT